MLSLERTHVPSMGWAWGWVACVKEDVPAVLKVRHESPKMNGNSAAPHIHTVTDKHVNMCKPTAHWDLPSSCYMMWFVGGNERIRD